MAVTRVKEWEAGQVLTADDLNTEFDNQNQTNVAFPLTNNVSAAGYDVSSANLTQTYQLTDNVTTIDKYGDSFATAISTIGSTVTTLMINQNVTVTANATVPSTLTLWFVAQGKLTVNVTVTVTINGPIIAGDQQIFAGSGTTVVAEGTTRQASWWNSNPSRVSGENILYDYINGGDSDNVLTVAGARGGYFADYDCQAKRVLVAQFNEDQSGESGGGFRDLLFLDVVDSDVVDYTLIAQKVTHGIRSYVQGYYTSSYQSIYKDLVGGSFAALGNVQWAARGCSGITAEAWQYGIGIASNEFAVNNPAAASGGVSQSESMAAIQAIIRSQYANEDGSHLSRGLIVENIGLRITAAIDILSTSGGGSFTSHYKYGIKMNGATINDAAIVMGGAGAGASIIQYDTNDYSSYDTSGNQFNWTIGANTIFAVKSNTLFIAETTNGSPVEGDFWYDGTNLRFRDATTSRTLSWT